MFFFLPFSFISYFYTSVIYIFPLLQYLLFESLLIIHFFKKVCNSLKGCSNLLHVLEFNNNYLVYSGIDHFILLSDLHSPPTSIFSFYFLLLFISFYNLRISLFTFSFFNNEKDTVLQIGVQLCDALAHMHKRLILHG